MGQLDKADRGLQQSRRACVTAKDLLSAVAVADHTEKLNRLVYALRANGGKPQDPGAIRLKREAADFIQEQARIIMRLEAELTDAYT